MSEAPKVISFVEAHGFHDKFAKLSESKVRETLGKCIEDFNAAVMKEMRALAEAGKDSSDLDFSFFLEKYDIQAPSKKLNVLMKTLEANRNWDINLLPQACGELGIPSPIDRKPVLRVKVKEPEYMEDNGKY